MWFKMGHKKMLWEFCVALHMTKNEQKDEHSKSQINPDKITFLDQKSVLVYFSGQEKH